MPSASRPLVLAMADKKPKKKVDSAVKRAKQSEARRIYNKSRKTEISTRMKKVRSPSPTPPLAPRPPALSPFGMSRAGVDGALRPSWARCRRARAKAPSGC